MRHNDSRGHHTPCDPGADATPAHRAWAAFHRAMLGHRQLMLQTLRNEGIAHSQAMVLRELSTDDGLAQRELAARMRVAPPTVTVMLQKMERAGLIERRPDATDQRITRVFVTDAGRALQATFHEYFSAMVETAMGSLTEAEQLELARLLTVLGDSFSASAANTPALCSPEEEVER